MRMAWSGVLPVTLQVVGGSRLEDLASFPRRRGFRSASAVRARGLPGRLGRAARSRRCRRVHGAVRQTAVQPGAAGLQPRPVAIPRARTPRVEASGRDVVLGPVEHRGNDTTWVPFHLRKANSALDRDQVPGDHLGGGPVVVAGDQRVLAKLSCSRPPGRRVNLQARRKSFRAHPRSGHCPGDDAAHPRLGGDRGDRGFDLARVGCGCGQGQRRSQLSRYSQALWPGRALNPAAWAWCSSRGVGEDGAAPARSGLAAGVVSGQPADRSRHRSGARAEAGRGGPVRAVRGGPRPLQGSARPRHRLREKPAARCSPAVDTPRSCQPPPPRPRPLATASYRVTARYDLRELGDVQLVRRGSPRLPSHRDPAVPEVTTGHTNQRNV